jgi:hypothetical protein
VKKLRTYEANLLGYYQRYCRKLEELVKELPGYGGNNRGAGGVERGRNGGVADEAARVRDEVSAPGKETQGESGVKMSAVGLTSIKCLCELLKKLPEFNFRSNLIACIVPRAENKEPMIAGPCCSAIATAFKGDKSGEVSAEIVSRIGKLLKVRGQNLNPGLLQAVLYLDLREVGRCQRNSSAPLLCVVAFSLRGGLLACC